jgi:serine/threonine protein kinase
MADLDAATLAGKAVRLGLIAPGQVQDAWQELGSRGVPAEDLMRCLERKGALTPYQTSKLLKGDSDGFVLGGYRLLYKIASGSFGRVYRADEPSSGRVVALKVLRNKWAEKQHTVDLFLREGRMGMTLQHPNIVETIAVSQDRATGQYYIVMEFVEGGNLRDFLAIRNKLQPAEVLKLLEETSSALAYAFSKGATHRDMKLTNVLLSSQGVAKLVDFGLAGGQLGFDDKDTTVDRTVDYAGLEKASGTPSGDPRSDIFFLGCVAYELLTGRPPMDRNVRGSARMQPRRFTNIPPIKPTEVEAPPSVLRLVENMIAFNADLRFQTPSQLLDRVREVRAELEGRSRNPGQVRMQYTVFIAERDEGLQDILRTKLKERGYRVLIAGDPERALDRFRQQPFDLLIVDTKTTGETGYLVFQRIMDDARRQEIPCGGILMLPENQPAWKAEFENNPNVAMLAPPVSYKQLVRAMEALLSSRHTFAQ